MSDYHQAIYHKKFFERLEWLLETEKWSASEIEAYQNERLRILIEEAYENVLYYRELMDCMKLRPSDIREVKDLTKLPLLKKEDIRNNSEKFISRKTNKRNLIFRHTSGTTGKSLHFYLNQETETLQYAIWWRHRNRFGMTNDGIDDDDNDFFVSNSQLWVRSFTTTVPFASLPIQSTLLFFVHHCSTRCLVYYKQTRT